MLDIEESHSTDDTIVSSAKDWHTPDDTGNPQNWSTLKKIYHTLIPTSIAFLCPFGSSVYTPGRDEVITRFHTSKEVALLPFSLYLLGLSFGPVFAGPLSETFGRKSVYVFGLPLFGLFVLGSGFSQSIASLIVCRFFAGFFSSPGLSLGTGTVSDVWTPETKGLPMSIFVFSVQMGPALGPMIGGFLVANKSWRWTQWVILFALVPILAITSGMDETYKRVILRRRAKKLGIDGPPTEDWSDPATIKYFARRTIIRPLHMLFTETIVTLFDIYVAINFGILNAFFAAFPHVFATTYDFKLSSIGLTFLGQAVGSLCGLCIMLAFDRYIYQRWARALKDQQSKDEKSGRRLGIESVGIRDASARADSICVLQMGSDVEKEEPICARAVRGREECYLASLNFNLGYKSPFSWPLNLETA